MRSTNLPFSKIREENNKFYKICSLCKLEKETTEFTPDLRRSNGTQARCKQCCLETWGRKRTKEYIRNSNLKHFYGITLEEYNNLYKQQEGKCLICRLTFDKLVVDHCHKTTNIRGLLCTNCNVGIGNLQHNIEILYNAIEYLTKAIYG